MPLEELLARSVVVTLHVPLVPSTVGLIGAAELALMKPDAILLNTCRGKFTRFMTMFMTRMRSDEDALGRKFTGVSA